jgi:hypothetical protein
VFKARAEDGPIDYDYYNKIGANMNILLLTHNIGSVECSIDDEVAPENTEKILNWVTSVDAFIQTEEKRGKSPIDLVVIHVQEIGGKKFNRPFNQLLQSIVCQCWPDAAWCSGLLGPFQDDDLTFTAMGTVIFLGKRVTDQSSLWSFRDKNFVDVQDIPSSSLQEVTQMEMSGTSPFFFGAKFSSAGPSRKGFLLTTLQVGSTSLNFLNLHLCHDSDNTVAVAQPFPSEYSLKRAEALTEAVKKVSKVIDIHNEPLFLFGDLNLRLDTHSLMTFLEEKFDETIQVEKKKVMASARVWDFLHCRNNWVDLKQLDKDAAALQEIVRQKTDLKLAERPIEFGLTYLLEDDQLKARRNRLNQYIDASNDYHGNDDALSACYQRTRFPAWCDRVWYNTAGGTLVERGKCVYWNASLYPMDHLPVYLQLQLENILVGASERDAKLDRATPI